MTKKTVMAKVMKLKMTTKTKKDVNHDVADTGNEEDVQNKMPWKKTTTTLEKKKKTARSNKKDEKKTPSITILFQQ